MTEDFYVETEPVDNGPGRWQYLRVTVLQRTVSGGKKVGEYVRNFNAMYHTFYPFQQQGKWFALYSTDYTATRLMELPSCRDIAGEEPHSQGFCPVDYYVPCEHARVIAAAQDGTFGFVSGCVWGDDSSWKIQFLDLSNISSGIIHRKEMFGYLAMPQGFRRLSECVSLECFYPPETPVIKLTAEVCFNVLTGARCELGDV